MAVTAEDVLAHTIEVLDRDGWCKNAYHDAQGRHCLVGALMVATAEVGAKRPNGLLRDDQGRIIDVICGRWSNARDRAYMAARIRLEEVLLATVAGAGSIVLYNDEKAKTKAQVKAILAKAIKAKGY